MKTTMTSTTGCLDVFFRLIFLSTLLFFLCSLNDRNHDNVPVTPSSYVFVTAFSTPSYYQQQQHQPLERSSSSCFYFRTQSCQSRRIRGLSQMLHSRQRRLYKHNNNNNHNDDDDDEPYLSHVEGDNDDLLETKVQQQLDRRRILQSSVVSLLSGVGWLSFPPPSRATLLTISSSASLMAAASGSLNSLESSFAIVPVRNYSNNNDKLTTTSNSSRQRKKYDRSGQFTIPKVGYSLYKTPLDQVEEGIRIALKAGVRHFDVATDYGTNEMVGKVLQEYILTGFFGFEDDDLNNNKNINVNSKSSSSSLASIRQRRNELFITHKLSNKEQSTNPMDVQNAVLYAQKQLLGDGYGGGGSTTTSSNKPLNNRDKQMLYDNTLDLVMIHSPLTNYEKRITTYSTLINMQQNQQLKAVGVCHFGIVPLQQLLDQNLPPPVVIQLVLSPFNQHKSIVQWAREHDCLVSCNGWSKLSSTMGPIGGWTVLADLAKRKNVTKSQLLIKWAIQNEYLCVPRSNSKYKIEKQNIIENSWIGTNDFVLTQQEMKIINDLDEQYPAGKLGIVDGWNVDQIIDTNWDPTTAIV